MNRCFAHLLLLSLCVNLVACTTPLRLGETGTTEFQLQQVAKTDTDMATDRVIQANLADLETLMVKLYKRNPREWQKTGIGPEQRRDEVFGSEAVPYIEDLAGLRDLEALRMAFRESYEGDRVLAFIYGLKTMIMTAYSDKTDFYLFDDLDPQVLYNSARNLEIAAWKLAHDHDENGRIYLLSNAITEDVQNLSFERLIGKLIARQDIMSDVVSDKTNRAVKSVLQSLASAVFLPIY